MISLNPTKVLLSYQTQTEYENKYLKYLRLKCAVIR